MHVSEFPLEAPMRVLETLAQPAKIAPLGAGECSICTLSQGAQRVGARPRVPGHNGRVAVHRGGIAMSKKRLDEDAPASPAPGVQSTPQG
eukprot:5220061-Pyramimonas_sp.AAC.1